MPTEGPVHADRRRAESFGSVAAAYDRYRPSYPDALIDDLVDLGDDARSGALNGILLSAASPDEVLAAIPAAVEKLEAGLRGRDGDPFLWFVGRYAGL